MIEYLQKCRLCGGGNFKEVLNLGEQYIQGAFETKDNPKPCRRKIRNRIIQCDLEKGGCSLVQSDLTVDPDILFSSYFYRSGVSNSMRNHLKEVVEELCFMKSPYKVLDVAANDLTLLKNYRHHVLKVGVDPNNIITSEPVVGIQVINDFFPTTKLAESELFDHITCLAVLYDINNPIHFCRMIRKHLSPDGLFCFEVMYLPSIIESLAYDTFLAEHLTHFSFYTINKMLEKSDMKIVKIRKTETNGGSVLVHACRLDCNGYYNPDWQNDILEFKKREFEAGLDNPSVITNFKGRVFNHLEKLHETVRNLKKDGKKICLYGCSTKANVVIEAAGISSFFDYGIERSENKFGGKTLWGLEIKSEEEARKDVDDKTVWFCGPYFFKKEFIERESEFLKKGGRLLFPLPQIEIV